MSDQALIIIASPFGPVALTREELHRGRRLGAELVGDTGTATAAGTREGGCGGTEKLVDADGMAALTQVPASWFATWAATRGEADGVYRLGRWVRFRPSEVLRSDQLARRLGHEVEEPKLPPSRQEQRLLKGRAGK